MSKYILKLKTVLMAIKAIRNWPLYFGDYFKLFHSPVILELRNEIFLKIRPKTTDRTIFNEIWLRQFYTPKTFEIGESDIVFDLGAHIGLFSVFAATLAKKGRVYSFEPLPDNFELLKDNIRLNNLKNIKPINKAVANESGTREFILSDNASGNYFASFRDNKENKITVQTINLEEFIKGNNINVIDFLKIDCEKAEYEILFNCPLEIFKSIKKISMEHHNVDSSRNANQLKLFLEKMGFGVLINKHMLYAMR